MKWTKEDIQYLADHYGLMSVGAIANKLGRTENAVLTRVTKMHLGAFLENGDYISFNLLINTLGIRYDSYRNISWIKNRGFPVHRKKVRNCYFKIVYIDEFWKWAEKHQSVLDFSNFEENVLGKEPDWVKKKRKRDIQRKQEYIRSPWTFSEDERLKILIDKGKGILEISKELRRTCGAIQRRCYDLQLSKRPKKAYCHNSYSNDEIQLIIRMILDGFSYEEISNHTKRSSKALRGLVYRKCGTENLDKAREVLIEGHYESEE